MKNSAEGQGQGETLKKLQCWVCDGTDFDYDHCKVRCRKCGNLIENCSGD